MDMFLYISIYEYSLILHSLGAIFLPYCYSISLRRRLSGLTHLHFHFGVQSMKWTLP